MIMGIQYWKHQNVDKEGRILKKKKNKSDRIPPHWGGVSTKPSINISNSSANCGLDGCLCSDGHVVRFGLGRNPKNNIVEGFTVYFSDRESVVKFSKDLKLNVKEF